MSALRVLHVLGGLVRGGAETWLMHVLRRLDRTRFQLDFLVHTDQPRAYDDEARALGARIIPCLYPHRPWRYARNFRRALREHGPYDVIHSHVHHFSGCVLRLAQRAGIPVRIAHSHNDTSADQARAGPGRRLYLGLMRRWLDRYATHGLAASAKAVAALFGADWTRDPRWRILYCGIDLEPFRVPVDRAAVRAELGLPEMALVVGHVGRFHEQKNHAFLLEIAAELFRREPRARLLLVGDGPLRPGVERRVVELGLARQVVFAGARSDVPRLMRGAMDVFVMPSLYEGLPLAGLEAQAAGLPLLLSDVITDEADVIRPLIRRLSLSQPASEWAAEVQAAARTGRFESVAAVAQMAQSPFDVAAGARQLTSLYAEAAGTSPPPTATGGQP